MQTLEHQFTVFVYFELEDKDSIHRSCGTQKQTGNKKWRTRLGNEFLFPESMGHYVKLYPDVYTVLLTHKLYQTEKS